MKQLIALAAFAPLMLMAASTESSGGSGSYGEPLKTSDIKKSETEAQIAASQRNETSTTLSQSKSNFENAVRVLIDEAKGNGLEPFDIASVLENSMNSLKTVEEQGLETTTETK